MKSKLLGSLPMIDNSNQVPPTGPSISDFNPNPIFAVSIDGSIVYVNSSGKSLLSHLSDKDQLKVNDKLLAKVKESLESDKKVVTRSHVGSNTYSVSIVPSSSELAYLYIVDITINSHFQEKLKESDERYRILAEFSSDVISRHDMSGTFLYVSPACASVFCIEMEHVIGHKIFEFISEEDREPIRKYFESEGSEKGVFTYRFQKKDGSELWIESKFQKFYNSKFGEDEVVVVSRDISEKIIAEQKLQESESRYRGIVESSLDFIYTADPSGNFTFLNSVGLKKIGYTYEEIIGQNFKTLIHPEWRERVVEFYKTQFTNKELTSYYEFPVVSKSGEVWWVGQNVQISLAGNWILGFQAYARDITERRKAEDNLKKQEKLTQSILDTLPIAIFLKDRSGKFVFVNNHASISIGFPKDEIIGKRIIDFMPYEEFGQVSLFGDQEAWKSSYYFGEERSQVKGIAKVSLVGKTILKTSASEEPLLLGYSIDITERKRMEEELVLAKKQLEDLIIAKEKFISIMSHEIRTPMNAVVGITNLLLQQVHGSNQDEYFNALKISSENLLKILNNVLDLSKIESGKVNFEEKDFSLSELLAKVKELFVFKAAEKNVAIETQIQKDIPDVIKGDPFRLNQILVNLLSNAVKFTESGKIIVSVTLMDTLNDSVHLLFSVSDTGIGIPEDKMSMIFESFTQADPDITRKYGGTGLGLTITKKLVELQGGNIGVESKINRGTKFNFDLLFSKSLGVELGADNDHSMMRDFSGLKALVVEDNKMNQMVVSKFLERENIEAVIAENGKLALERIANEKFDIVLMDIQMPEMDGFEAAKYIRDKLKLKDIPIIAFTAFSSSEIERKVNQAGMNGYIVKPFEPSVFYDIIAKHTNVKVIKKAMGTPERKSYTSLSYLKEASGNNKVFIGEMIDVFLKQTPLFIESLKKFYEEQNWVEFRKSMHKLKPTITMMGISAGEKLVKSIEKNVKEMKDFDLVKRDLLLLEEICDNSYHELKDQLTTL